MSQANPRVSTVWKCNDVELVLDMTDVDTIERYEKAVANMENGIKALPKDGSQSAVIKAYCLVLRNVFDDLFGEGTAEKIFGKCMNATELTEAYESFLQFVSEQGQEFTNMQNRIAGRYSPNRAQRRAGK